MQRRQNCDARTCPFLNRQEVRRQKHGKKWNMVLFFIADTMVLFTAQAQTSGIASPFCTQPPLAETSQKSWGLLIPYTSLTRWRPGSMSMSKVPQPFLDIVNSCRWEHQQIGILVMTSCLLSMWQKIPTPGKRRKSLFLQGEDSWRSMHTVHTAYVLRQKMQGQRVWMKHTHTHIDMQHQLQFGL